METAFLNLTLLDKVHVLTFQHNWLHTGAQSNKFQSTVSDKCPTCTTAVEDWTHLFGCSHDLACTPRTHMFAKLQTDLMKNKTNSLIQNVIIFNIQQWCGHVTTPPIIPADKIDSLLSSDLEEQKGWAGTIS
eukprot:6046983-Ditylum_brightwellii.AAC.1